MGMTQTNTPRDTNSYPTDEISDLVKSIARHGERAIRDINRLHALVPKARLEIVELVDEAENNIILRAEVERLDAHLKQDLGHRATVTMGVITHQALNELIATAVAYGNARVAATDTAKLVKTLDAVRVDLENAEFVDLFDVAIRYGMVRARRQRSARMIRGTVEAIRALAD